MKTIEELCSDMVDRFCRIDDRYLKKEVLVNDLVQRLEKHIVKLAQKTITKQPKNIDKYIVKNTYDISENMSMYVEGLETENTDNDSEICEEFLDKDNFLIVKVREMIEILQQN